MQLKDKVAIVTGASKGIGKAIALLLASQGAKIVVNFATEKMLAEEVVKKIGHNQALAFAAHVEKPDEVASMIRETLKHWGRIDILINNAGIINDKFLMVMTDDEWQKVIDVNLTGVFNCCRAVAKQMVAQKSGKIVNISSTAAVRGLPRPLPKRCRTIIYILTQLPRGLLSQTASPSYAKISSAIICA